MKKPDPIFHLIGARLGEANTLKFMGKLAMAEEKWAIAKENLTHGLKICLEINNHYGAAWAFYDLGQIAAAQKETAARQHYRQALTLFTAIGLQSQVEMVRQALNQLS